MNPRGLEDTRDMATQRMEKRYDELRRAEAPTAADISERQTLATELYGPRADAIRSNASAVYKALESSISENLEPSSQEERKRRLQEAESLIEATLAGR